MTINIINIQWCLMWQYNNAQYNTVMACPEINAMQWLIQCVFLTDTIINVNILIQ